jgi:phosphoserine phosphatase RsbU/P
MVLDSAIQALSGAPLLKLVLALILGGVFFRLRRNETEGVMSGFAALALVFLVRDLAFDFVPVDALFRLSDLIAFGFMAYIAVVPFGGGWELPLALALDGVAALFLALGGLASLLPFPSGSELCLLAAAFPLAALFSLPPRRNVSASSGRELVLDARLPLLIGGCVYLLAEALLGPRSAIFQTLIVPAWYVLFLFLAFRFSEILRHQLVAALDYYEDAIDSLYELLLSSGSATTAASAMQEALDTMARVGVEKTGADGGAIFLTEEFEDVISMRAISGTFPPPFKLPESLPRSEERVASYVRHARFKLGEGLLGEAAKTGKPLYIPEAKADPRVARNGEDDWLRLSSLIAIPLIVRDRSIGVLAVEKTSGSSFSERDFDRAKLLSSFGSISVANSFSFLEAVEQSDIEHEASIAVGIQKMVEPKAFPSLAGLSFGGFTLPARGVCSDYYDCIQTRIDRVVLAVGDVAGKGVQAGLVMAMMRSILHLITASSKDASTLLSWVNRGITGQVDLDHFATLGLVSVNATSGEVEFANAAQQPLLVFRKDSGAIETIDIKSIPIGVERSTEYGVKRFRLRPGDVLVMYTDGVVEAMNDQGKQYGRKKLGAAVAESSELAAAAIADAIRKDVEEFAGRSRQHDDQTVLVMKA